MKFNQTGNPMTKKSKQLQARISDPTLNNQPIALNDFLNQMAGSDIYSKLLPLWNCWPYVIGKELSEIAFPIGHRKNTLIIGCEDAICMQELRMMQKDILERVNAFLRENIFTQVRVELLLNKHSLYQPTPKNETKVFPVSKATGKFLEYMDPNSEVAKCYAAFSAQKNSPHSDSNKKKQASSDDICKAPLTGSFLNKMDQSSPVAKCYAQFCQQKK